MPNRKRDTYVQNRLLDSLGEGEGGMFWENGMETCILSRVKQITSPGWMHETSAWAWCTGKTQRDWVEREVGGVLGWGIHVNPWLIHVNVWQKPLQYYKVISLQLIKINEKKNKVSHLFHFFLIPLPWSDGTGCHDLSSLKCWVLSQLFHSPLSSSSRGSLVCFLPLEYISEVIDISPSNLDSSLCFIHSSISHDAYKLNKQGDSIYHWCTPFLIWNQSTVPCSVLTVASWPAYRFLRR